MSLTFETDGAIARVTLNRPEHGNTIDTTVVVQLRDACEAVSDDAEVRAVVLTAAGDVFSSGWDWEALANHGDDAVEAARDAGMLDDPFGSEAIGQCDRKNPRRARARRRRLGFWLCTEWPWGCVLLGLAR